MLSFITFTDAPEQIEIYADENGIEELINYLKLVNRDRDHMHLFIDNELDPIEFTEDRQGKSLYAKHVRIQFANE